MALLKRHNISRLTAFELAGQDLAKPANPNKLPALFEALANSRKDIMIFCGNAGLVQIYSGSIHKLVPMAQWFNVLDPNFNLHLDLSQVAQVWTAVRPSADGNIHSVELFDSQGEQVLQLFSRRIEGTPEPDFWAPLINQILHGA